MQTLGSLAVFCFVTDFDPLVPSRSRLFRSRPSVVLVIFSLRSEQKRIEKRGMVREERKRGGVGESDDPSFIVGHL